MSWKKDKNTFKSIKFGKNLGFGIYKLVLIIIINKNKNFVFAVFEIVLPSFEKLNNG